MAQSSKIATCLWYDGVAEDAATLYTTLIPDSGITGRFRPDPTAPPLLVEFTLAGVPYQALNGGPHFTLSEAASIVVLTDDQTETDRLWEALTAALYRAGHGSRPGGRRPGHPGNVENAQNGYRCAGGGIPGRWRRCLNCSVIPFPPIPGRR